MSEARLVRKVVVPIVVAAVLMVWVFLRIDRLRQVFRGSHPEVDGDAASAWTPTTWWIVIPFTLMSGLATYVLHTLAHRNDDGPARNKLCQAAVFSSLLGGCLFSLLFVWVPFTFSNLDDALGPAAATFGPSLALWVVVVAFLAEVAFLGGTIHEGEREWWARLSAWLLMAAVAWSTLNNMYANRLIRCYLGASRPKPRWWSRWVDGVWAPGGGALRRTREARSGMRTA
jgi:hypothetical protein